MRLAKRLASYHVKTIEPAFVKQAEILMACIDCA